MNSISDDIAIGELWKFMSIDNILNYCSTNKKFSKICKDQNTWKFLLERDFNITNHIGNQKNEYMRLYNERKYNKLGREKINEFWYQYPELKSSIQSSILDILYEHDEIEANRLVNELMINTLMKHNLSPKYIEEYLTDKGTKLLFQ